MRRSNPLIAVWRLLRKRFAARNDTMGEVRKMIQDITLVKRAIVRTLDELRPDQVAELWDFAAFLQERARREPLPQTARVQLRLAPIESLTALTGLVALGGDALADSETDYDEDTHSH